MPRIFINLEAGCLQVNLMSTSTEINQLKYTILYYIKQPFLSGNSLRRDLKEILKKISKYSEKLAPCASTEKMRVSTTLLLPAKLP